VRTRHTTRGQVTIAASRIVPASRTVVFAFLAEMHNHWTLAGDRIELVEVDNGPERGPGAWGVVMIRGPFGIRRRARTRVLELTEPSAIGGLAEVGARTRARVRWELSPAPDGGTTVSLSATVEDAGPTDRLLLAAGGKLWMGRVFAATLSRLAAQTGGPPAPSERVKQRPR
jgi:hypothetical protein